MKREINNRLRGATRRDFIKGVLTASAALGLGPTRALEVLDGIGGEALAADACATACRTINIVAGHGALSWFTLLWPVPTMIKTFQAGFAYDDTKKAMPISGLPGGRELYVRQPDPTKPALWQNYGTNKLVSAILCGVNSGHENAPVHPLNSNVIPDGVGGQVQVYAAGGAIQQVLSPLVPVIGLSFQGGNMPYGAAPGAPAPATVPGAAEMIGLFSSQASQRMDRLANPNNQVLFDTYYKAMLGLTKTATRATFQQSYSGSKTALDLVAKNLGSQLAVSQAQIATWCGPAAANSNLQAFAGALAVASNAFKLGLTAQVNIPAFMDDPHGAFADGSFTSTGYTGTFAGNFADGLANVMQSFLDDLSTTSEVGCSKKLSDNVVITVSGDLPKNSYIAAGWPDSTPGNANLIYVMSQGWIKPGWAGDIQPTQKILPNPLTGNLDPTVQDQAATDAGLAAVLYAVSQGDDRQVRNYFTGNYSGLVNQNLMG